MSVYDKPDSPFWWMLLEGQDRRRESTGIPRDATTAEQRKTNRAEAEAIYHARMTQLARGRVGLPIDSGETFATWSAWYETHHTATHDSAARERVILARLRAHFGPMVLSQIRPARWQEYATQRLEDGVAANTIGRELATMKSVLKAAVGEHLEVSPLAHVVRRTTKVPPKRTITKAEEPRLLEELTDPEIHDLYLVGVGTLLRQVNLITLQRRQLRGDRLVVDTKTGPHVVPLSGPTILQRRAAMVLKRRLPAKADGFFFPVWQARFATNRDSGNAWFLKIVRRAAKRAGIPWGLHAHGVVWHTMTRASGATRMLREHGLDIRTVQLLGPWSSLDQMAEYLGIDPTVLAAPARPKRAVHQA